MPSIIVIGRKESKQTAPYISKGYTIQERMFSKHYTNRTIYKQM